MTFCGMSRALLVQMNIFGIGVAVNNVLINGFDQFGHAAEYAAAQPLGLDASEEAQSGALGRAR